MTDREYFQRLLEHSKDHEMRAFYLAQLSVLKDVAPHQECAEGDQ
jgi:hypothetical protein